MITFRFHMTVMSEEDAPQLDDALKRLRGLAVHLRSDYEGLCVTEDTEITGERPMADALRNAGFNHHEFHRDDVEWSHPQGPVLYKGEADKLTSLDGLVKLIYEKGRSEGAELIQQSLRDLIGLKRGIHP